MNIKKNNELLIFLKKISDFNEIESYKKNRMNISISIVNKLENRYPDFFYESINIRRPNVNKNVLIYLFYNLNIVFDKNTIDIIMIKLKSLNEFSLKYCINSNTKISKKCKKYRFFLFYMDFYEIKRILEYEINNIYGLPIDKEFEKKIFENENMIVDFLYKNK